jgi:hypothetical protein
MLIGGKVVRPFHFFMMTYFQIISPSATEHQLHVQNKVLLWENWWQKSADQTDKVSGDYIFLTTFEVNLVNLPDNSSLTHAGDIVEQRNKSKYFEHSIFLSG